jgi:hypothetical protein
VSDVRLEQRHHMHRQSALLYRRSRPDTQPPQLLSPRDGKFMSGGCMFGLIRESLLQPHPASDRGPACLCTTTRFIPQRRTCHQWTVMLGEGQSQPILFPINTFIWHSAIQPHVEAEAQHPMFFSYDDTLP